MAIAMESTSVNSANSATNLDFTVLLQPLLSKLCEFYAFKQVGQEVPYELLYGELKSELNALSLRCSASPLLQQRYVQVEQVVIFFIDYTVKEGQFSYSAQYEEMARAFHEFSGDEKFFDLLEETLKQGTDLEMLRLFYLLLGLGFDGIFKRERPYVHELMHQIKERLPPTFAVQSQELCPEDKDEAELQKHPKWYQFNLKKMVFLLIAITILAWAFNFSAFYHAVSPFLEAVDTAAQSSNPYRS